MGNGRIGLGVSEVTKAMMRVVVTWMSALFARFRSETNVRLSFVLRGVEWYVPCSAVYDATHSEVEFTSSSISFI